MSKLLLPVILGLSMLMSCENNPKTTNNDPAEHADHSNVIDNKDIYINGEELKNYYLPNSFQFEDTYLVEVIQDQAGFEKHLHPAATMDSKFKNIDFDKEFVLVVAGKTSDLKPHFNIETIDKNGSTLHIRLKEVKDTVVNSFSITPLLAYAFLKDGVSKIRVDINDYTTEKSVN